MKLAKKDFAATEKARTALDEIETAFRVRSGVKAGAPPEHANNENGVGNPHNEPIIQPLYGTVVL